MADIKISQLPLKSTLLSGTDLLEVSEAQLIPGVFVSKKMNRLKLTESIFAMGQRASFYNDQTQIALAINTPTVISLPFIENQNGVNLNGVGQIEVTNEGLYNLQISAQIYRTTIGTSQHLDVWLRVNGTDLVNTNRRVNVNNHTTYIVESLNYFVQLNALDYIEIIFSTTSTDIQLQAEPINITIPHPETPSVIATINRIG